MQPPQSNPPPKGLPNDPAMTPGGPHLDAGECLGRYRILRRLGSGAMGDVFLAQDPKIERLLAIKTVRFTGLRPAEVEERTARLLREAKAAGRLSHPNIVTLFDVGEDRGILFLAFEYIAGKDLHRRLLEDGPITLGEALSIARQSALGLDYAHRQGIVHRDIKPGNLLLDGEGGVKVGDFGIAKLLGQSTELTTTGMVLGSPQYLSPEQVRGEPLDGASDLFSLGVVLYELASGKAPFDGETLSTLVYQILSCEPPPLTALDPRLPAELSALVGCLLDKERGRRPASAGEVAEALADLEASLPADMLLGSGAKAEPMATAPTRVLPPTPPPPPPAPPAASPGQPASAAGPSGPAPRGSEALAPPRPAGISRTAWVVGALGVCMLLVIAVCVAALAWRWSSLQEPASEVAELSNLSPVSVEAPTSADALGNASEPSPPQEAFEQRDKVATEKLIPAKPIPAEPRIAKPIPAKPIPARPMTVEPKIAEPPATRVAVATAEPQATNPQATNPTSSRSPAGRTLDTALAIVFRVQPAEAFFLLDGRLIGRVAEYGPGEEFTLPGPGDYDLVLRQGGFEDYRLHLRADAGRGGTSVVTARLDAIPAAEVELGDLPLYRVSEAVAFRVRPANTRVMVDGKFRGPALKFAGRRGRAGEWLRLDRGMHRISFVAPGHRRRDIVVDFTAGAREQRQRITLELVAEK